jgi:hypothetical protein
VNSSLFASSKDNVTCIGWLVWSSLHKSSAQNCKLNCMSLTNYEFSTTKCGICFMQLKEVEIYAVGKEACGLCWNTLLYRVCQENLPCIEGAFIKLNYISTT